MEIANKRIANRRIACWMSEKKFQKLNWAELAQVCKTHGYEIFQLDLNKNLELQGQFCVLLHKLTDIIASAIQGDAKSTKIIKLMEDYISRHPEVVVIDPIPNVRQLINRFTCYSIIGNTDLHNYKIFTPNFCEITTTCVKKTSEELKKANITCPFMCKPTIGHGKKAHNMLIIFNENYLEDCKPPCVAQSFINHSAVLYKIFIIYDQFYYVERPSLKNFNACDRDSIFFDSSDVSKAGSESTLSILDPEDEAVPQIKPSAEILEKIALTLRNEFRMDLLGVDVVIENYTGKYAIIDVNCCPGYDSFPNFLETLVNCIKSRVKISESSVPAKPYISKMNCLNSL